MATKSTKDAFDPQELRRKALKQLQKRHGKVVDMPVADVATLVHELEVYQVELEVQNEDLRRAQLELAAAAERYRDLYHRAPVGYLTLDADGIVLQANQAAAKICFQNREELEGERLETLAFHKDRDKLWLLLQSATLTGLPQASEFRIVRPLGDPRWVRADISGPDYTQQASGVFRMTLTDITARVQAEVALQEQRAEALKLTKDAIEARTEAERVSAELRESEERFHLLADNMSQLAWTCDLLGNVTWYNKRWLEYTGLTFEDMKGWGWSKVQHPDHVERVVARVKRSSETGEPWEDIFPLLGKDGGYRWFLSRAMPIRDEHGDFVQWFGTNTDVTEQVLAEEQVARQAQELLALNERLKELDRLKNEFFSNVSHEFRTPLTLMLGLVEEILAEPEGGAPPEIRESLTAVRRNSLRLLKLVNTLLDFSRIEAGRIQAVYEPTDLPALTADLASAFRSAIEKAGLKLVVDCPPTDEPVYVDREMWEKIVLNLLSNAFKFTFDGAIKVTVRQAEGAVEVVVSDTGIGIPAVELPRLFDRFHRVEGARGRSYEGSGIGLALAKELVKLHGGSVRVESEVDRGSAFTVTIPLGKAHLPAERIGAERTLASTRLRSEAYVEEVLPWLPEEDGATGRRGDRATGAAELHLIEDTILPRRSVAPSLRPRVLLADDNADMRDYLRRLLGGQYEVVAVADGAAALEAARAGAFDLVLTDVMMPRLDGVGLLRELRADERTKTIPVILLSARAGEESRVEGMEAGADDYLIKPFSARELLARVESNVKLAQLRGRLFAETARMAAIVESSDDAIISKDLNGIIASWNKGAERLFGYAAEEVIGKPMTILIPPDRADEELRILETLRRGERIEHYETVRRRKDGSEIDISLTISPIRDKTGKIIGASKIARDIGDRKRIEKEREEMLLKESSARAEAEAANRSKDEFLAVVSHELRSPLNAILGYNRMLRERLPDESQLKQSCDVIERNARTQLQLIEDLLDTARIVSGRMRLEVGPVKLSRVIASAIETVRPSADGKGVAIIPTLDPGSGEITGDPDRLQQVVWNLLSNAVKFTPAGGRVHIELRRGASETRIVVRDTGEGIRPDLLPYVFERFSQGETSRTRRHGGLGLGLALVKELVEMHGGTIEAASEGVGHGATFTVTLPINSPQLASHLPPTPALAETGAEPDEIAMDDLPRLDGLRALVVDDHEDAREMISEALGERGAAVTAAASGREALELLEGSTFDAMVSDIAMPEMDGYELIRRLRSMDTASERRLPAIALTAMAHREDRLRALEAGFQAHVAKPVKLAELVITIASIVEWRQKELS